MCQDYTFMEFQLLALDSYATKTPQESPVMKGCLFLPVEGDAAQV